MSLLRVCKKYPEIKEIISERLDAIYEKAQLVEEKNVEDGDLENELVDNYLKNYLLETDNVPRDIIQILDNFEEFMGELSKKPGETFINIIGFIIEHGGLSEEFKNSIGSYENIAINYTDKEPYMELFELAHKSSLPSENPIADFVVIAVLNKRYKEDGRIIEISQRDLSVLSSLSKETINLIIDNWNNGYQELFNQVDRIQGRVNSDYPNKVITNDIAYKKKLKYFLNEYIDLDENKKKYLLEYLKTISSIDRIDDDPIINTIEKIRNIDESIFCSVKENPEKVKDFLRKACPKNYNEKYFNKIEDRYSLSIINLYNAFLDYMYSSNYDNAQKILKDNNINIFELVEKIKELNDKYAIYCHQTISKRLTDYQEIEKQGEITSRVENGCKIYELKGQPFFGILHTANANLDNFYLYEEYAFRTGEHISDEEKESKEELDEEMLYSRDKDKRSCSTIGNQFLGYVTGGKNRKVIHFGITKIDSSKILISSNKDLDIEPGETIEQISARNMQYQASEILNKTDGPYNETLIKSFNEDGTPIKFDIIYSFHVDGPTQEEIEAANRFGIDIVWVDVRKYDKQRRRQLALELNSGISDKTAQSRYYHYINGRGYELGEKTDEPSIEDIIQDKEIAIELLHDAKDTRDKAIKLNLEVRQLEEDKLRGTINEE